MTKNHFKTLAVPIIVLALLIGMSEVIHAQRAPMKYGKIDQKDLEMTRCEADTNAKALILGDFGEVTYQFNAKEDLELVYTRHLRIKIFDQEATSYGDFKLKLWRGVSLEGEKITKLKAVTFNLVDGSIEKTELDKKDIYEERISDYLYSANFSIPQLKAGSIFDLEYTIVSDLLGAVPDWRFQRDIPAVFSEYRFSYPEFFTFKQNMKGFLMLDINESSTSIGHFPGVANSGFSGNYVVHDFRFRIDDVPALKSEPYMNHPVNYYSGIEFELMAYQQKFGVYKDITGSWEKIDKELLSSDHFGYALNRPGAVKEVVAEITAQTADSIQMLHLAHTWVKNNVKWNKIRSVYTSNSLPKAINEQSGNVAEVNLLLVMLLRELGFDADPVISSTRDNGIIIKAHPMLSKFNYVLAYCKLGSQEFVMDATDDNLPFYLLPERAINSEGRIISKKFGRSGFIDISLQNQAVEKEISQLMIAPNGIIQARTTLQATQHIAAEMAYEYNKHQNDEAFIEAFESEHTGFDLIEINHNNLKDWFKPFEQVYRYDIKPLDETAEQDVLYIQPMLFSRLESNPFKEEKRHFPVDFVYPKSHSKTIRISLPPGYKVEEAPESVAFALPDNTCVYKYTILQSGAQIQLSTELQINQSFFGFNDYELLKAFFDQVVQKEDEIIVVSKL